MTPKSLSMPADRINLTDAQAEAARRYVIARNPDDADDLLAALGLNEEGSAA